MKSRTQLGLVILSSKVGSSLKNTAFEKDVQKAVKHYRKDGRCSNVKYELYSDEKNATIVEDGLLATYNTCFGEISILSVADQDSTIVMFTREFKRAQ